MEAMAGDWGGTINALRIDGGMAANDWLCQFLADLLNMPVERPKVIETTALGAACLAALKVGVFDGLESVSDAWRSERRFEPRMEQGKRDRLYGGWRDAVARTGKSPRSAAANLTLVARSSLGCVVLAGSAGTLGRTVDTVRPVFFSGPILPRSHPVAVAQHVADLALQQLAGGGVGQAVDEADIVGDAPFRHLAGEDCQQLLAGDGGVRLANDDQHRALAPFFVGHGDGGCLLDAGMADGDVLQIDGADPLAARLDDVLGTVDDLDIAVGIHRHHVAGFEPARHRLVGRAFGHAEIAGADGRAAHQQPAEAGAVACHVNAGTVDDAELHAADRPPLLGRQCQGGLGILSAVLALRHVGEAERAGFRHAPGMQNLHPHLLEALDHHRRAGRSADGDAAHGGQFLLVGVQPVQQRQPDGRHAGAVGDFLGLEQLVQAGAVQLAAGEDQLGADHRRGIGGAPGIDVEHRHHRQHHVRRRQAEHVRQAGGDGVHLRPVESVRLIGQQILVAQQVGQAGSRHVGAVGHHDDALQPGQLVGDALQQRQEGQVGEQQPVFGVVDDVGDLFREQARVDGMADHARAADAVIAFQMAVAVPGQRADSVARPHPQRRQRVRQLLGADPGVGVGVAVDRPLGGARHDLGVGMVERCVTQDRRHQQGAIHHHSAQHRFTPGGKPPFGVGLHRLQLKDHIADFGAHPLKLDEAGADFVQPVAVLPGTGPAGAVMGEIFGDLFQREADPAEFKDQHQPGAVTVGEHPPPSGPLWCQQSLFLVIAQRLRREVELRRQLRHAIDPVPFSHGQSPVPTISPWEHGGSQPTSGEWGDGKDQPFAPSDRRAVGFCRGVGTAGPAGAGRRHLPAVRHLQRRGGAACLWRQADRLVPQRLRRRFGLHLQEPLSLWRAVRHGGGGAGAAAALRPVRDAAPALCPDRGGGGRGGVGRWPPAGRTARGVSRRGAAGAVRPLVWRAVQPHQGCALRRADDGGGGAAGPAGRADAAAAPAHGAGLRRRRRAGAGHPGRGAAADRLCGGDAGGVAAGRRCFRRPAARDRAGSAAPAAGAAGRLWANGGLLALGGAGAAEPLAGAGRFLALPLPDPHPAGRHRVLDVRGAAQLSGLVSWDQAAAGDAGRCRAGAAGSAGGDPSGPAGGW
ncbi:hypothetical protein Lal_00014497 [Lupinus albus]|nr:hypothetical protein Lal_00014497 [Lupinus albus]